MAKAKQVPDAASVADLSEWAAGVLGLRLDEVISYAGAALVPDNVNGVHDMRVALRRLRSSLRDFASVLDEKKAARVKKDLKLIAGALGPVRDTDVAIISLNNFAADTDNPSIVEGIAMISGELGTDRQRSHKRFCRIADQIALDDLGERVDTALRQSKLFRPPSIKAAGRDVIKARLSDLDNIAGAIYDPFDTLGLHDIRIAIKRLRYAIELFGSFWGDEAAAIAGDLAKMQTHLGEVHDCDVWIEELGARLKHSAPATAQILVSAAAWLLSKFVARRSKAYLSALDLWRKWQSNGFTGRINSLILSE